MFSIAGEQEGGLFFGRIDPTTNVWDIVVPMKKTRILLNMLNPCPVRNTDNPRAGRHGAAPCGTARPDGDWQHRMPMELFALFLSRWKNDLLFVILEARTKKTLFTPMQVHSDWLTPDSYSVFSGRKTFFRDMPCTKKFYKNKYTSVHWSAARNEERFSSR